MDLQGKNVLVVGFGKSGQSAARFLLGQGCRVSVSDSAPLQGIPPELEAGLITVEGGGHHLKTFLTQDLIIVSPGVPLTIEPLVQARSQGITVIGEIELAARFLDAPVLAVTGTNGKTTTTALLGHLFTRAGRRVFTGGNIGTPLIDCLLEKTSPECVIAEISSFQLETIQHFRPRIAIVLNITDDHLDRYANVAEYRAAKARILMNMRDSDAAILNHDDLSVADLARHTSAQTWFFSTAAPLATGAWDDGDLHVRLGDERRLDLPGTCCRLRGAHNRGNVLAALTAALLCDLPPDEIKAALEDFAGLPHRMEHVASLSDVAFYNDSKATNVGACQKALESLTEPILLIAGGRDKGGSYQPLRRLVRDKVRALVLIGEARFRIAEELCGETPVLLADSLEAAVKTAYDRAAPGDAVLLSPACASFDMFSSYEERGDRFKSIVAHLRTDTHHEQ